MVQAFMALGQTELEAFQAYADVYPDECLLLVDTIDTLNSGVPNAIKVFENLRKKGHQPIGIRLDSGDLAHLSIQAARMLNEAGFPDAKIVLSNQLDEIIIMQILTQIQEEAADYGVDPDHLIKRFIYGVGTNLITSKGYPALAGVYKLVAVRENGAWQPAMKLSETPEKSLNPGAKSTWRLYDQRGMATADLIGSLDEKLDEQKNLTLRHPSINSKFRTLPRREISRIEPLHLDILREGKLLYDFPTLEQIRQTREQDLQCLDSGVRRLINPHIYHVSITQKLWDLKQQLIENARRNG